LGTAALIDNRGTARGRDPALFPYDWRRDDARYETEAKVKKVMHEYKEGELKSGSGRKVKSRKQAIAIAMSESGQSKRRNKAS